jgi:outer membrane immunogenic protein
MVDDRRRATSAESGARMRRLLISYLLVLGMVASISGVSAADYDFPTLRGSDTFVPGFRECCSRFAGIYVGGQVGANSTSVDFSNATQTLIAQMLQLTPLQNEAQVSTWQVLGSTDTRGRSWGGFVGYNTSWESLILGFEINYSRTDFSPAANPTPLSRIVTTSTFTYDVTLTGAARITLNDVATFRGRFGWEVGNFLPYAMIGVAAARANLLRTASAFGTQSSFDTPPVVTPFSFTQTQSKENAFLFGWSVGGGVDIMVLPNVFARAEFEYIALSPYWSLGPTIYTARAGLGYKF